MSTNQEQIDNIIRHRIQLRGQYTRISNELDDIISQLASKVLERIEKSGNLSNPSILNSLIKDLDVLMDAYLEDYEDSLSEKVADVGEYESSYSSNIATAFGLAAVTGLTRNSVKGLIKEQPVNGKLVSEMVDDVKRSVKNEVRQQVRLGASEGSGNIQSRIKSSVLDKAKSATGTLVRTVGEAVTLSVSSKIFEEGGGKYYQLSVILDSKTSKICASLDTSKVYRFDDPSAPRPPFHHNCRTTMLPLSDSSPIEKEPYSKWLARQSDSEQKSILGAARYKLYKNGMSINNFIDSNLQVIPLDELSKKNNN